MTAAPSLPRTLPGMADLAGTRATVMGLGRFGGGVGVTRWLASRGAAILVTDTAPEDELRTSVESIRDLVDSGAVTLRLGGHNVADFTTCDLVVASPAVPHPWDNRFLRAADAAGIPITTEIGLLVERLPVRERTIGVTGSVGKSTTAAMIAHALRATGHPVLLGGNIGGSLLEDIPSLSVDTWIVLELSSFMLHWLDRARWSPHIAVVTNIAPNHLDWHLDAAHYEQSKQVILRHQRPGDAAVLGPGVEHWRSLTPASIVAPPRREFSALRVPGAHNIQNAATALAVCAAAVPSSSPDRLAEALQTFPGLVHRLQLVAERPLRAGEAPARFYNDSKSTTPESTLRAIDALASMPGVDSSRIHLIAGGYDKGSDLSPISRVAPSLAGLYAIGATGPAIIAAAESNLCSLHATLDAAFSAAVNRMRPGDVLLLSPGCASWDQYSNYEERGEHFIRLVHERVGL